MAACQRKGWAEDPEAGLGQHGSQRKIDQGDFSQTKLKTVCERERGWFWFSVDYRKHPKML